MPYVQQIVRSKCARAVGTLYDVLPFGRFGPGTLNYMIMKTVIHFLGSNPNYEKYNSAIGVLESAKLELYRRQIAPYEDRKIHENGDLVWSE